MSVKEKMRDIEIGSKNKEKSERGQKDITLKEKNHKNVIVKYIHERFF